MYCGVLTSGIGMMDRVVERRVALADPEGYGMAQRTLDEAGVLDQRTLPGRAMMEALIGGNRDQFRGGDPVDPGQVA